MRNNAPNNFDQFVVDTDNKISNKQIEKQINEQLDSLGMGLDPFVLDPTLFTESDPVVWAEKLYCDRKGKPLKLWDHQKEWLRDTSLKKLVKGGRDTGKTIDLVVDITHYPFVNANKSVLMATPKKAHYSKVIKTIKKQIRHTPHLANYMWFETDDAGDIDLLFYNGSVVMFRQGFPDGEKFRSLDADKIDADESAYFSERARNALDGCLRSDGDGLLSELSSPDGRRVTEFYKNSHSDSYKVYTWHRNLNPNWDDALQARLIEKHGGKHTPGWLQEVAGEHGHPTAVAFDVEAIENVLSDLPDYALRRLVGQDFSDLLKSAEPSEDLIRQRIIDLLDLPKLRGVFYLCADLGSIGDPSEFVLVEEVTSGQLIPRLRISCKGLSYVIQEILFAILDTLYSPVLTGIDKGNNGLHVYQTLTEADQYKSHKFASKLFAYNFNAVLIVGYDKDSDGETDFDKPIKKYAKEHATNLLNEHFRKRQLLLPISDRDTEDQFVSHTYRLSGERIVYNKGYDHIVDAYRFLMLVKWINNEAPEIEPAREETVNIAVGVGQGAW